MPYFVIVWRAPGGEPYFFRGDDRYEVFLPYISEQWVSKGWVKEDAFARVFDAPIILDEAKLAKNFIASRLKVYPYTGPILPTHILRPTGRLNRGRYPHR